MWKCLPGFVDSAVILSDPIRLITYLYVGMYRLYVHDEYQIICVYRIIKHVNSIHLWHGLHYSMLTKTYWPLSCIFVDTHTYSRQLVCKAVQHDGLPHCMHVDTCRRHSFPVLQLCDQISMWHPISEQWATFLLPDWHSCRHYLTIKIHVSYWNVDHMYT